MTKFKCPICKRIVDEFPALSRKDNKTKICSNCGNDEAMEEYFKFIKQHSTN